METSSQILFAASATAIGTLLGVVGFFLVRLISVIDSNREALQVLQTEIAKVIEQLSAVKEDLDAMEADVKQAKTLHLEVALLRNEVALYKKKKANGRSPHVGDDE